MAEDLANAIRIVEAAGYRLVRLPKGGQTQATIALVLKRREEGWTDEATAAELGVTRSTVSGIIWRHKTKKACAALPRKDQAS